MALLQEIKSDWDLSRSGALSPSKGRDELQHVVSRRAETLFWHSLGLTINHTWKLSNVGQIHNSVVDLTASPSRAIAAECKPTQQIMSKWEIAPNTCLPPSKKLQTLSSLLDTKWNVSRMICCCMSSACTKPNKMKMGFTQIPSKTTRIVISAPNKHSRKIWIFLCIYFFYQIPVASWTTY